MNKSVLRSQTREWIIRILAGLISSALTATLLVLLILDGDVGSSDEKSVTIRQVEVAMPPPKEPPPPIKQRTQSTARPAINLVGPGSGPAIEFDSNPKLAVSNFNKVEQPEFNISEVDFDPSQFMNFPVFEVKELDQVPSLISSNYISFPKSIKSRGVKRVPTVVEILIDQRGKAYVKKIVDPVFPEMIDVIRKSINNSKFTIPKKNGKPVQAVYLYSLVFVDRT